MRKELPCTRGEVEELWEENAIIHSEELGDIVMKMEGVPVVDAVTGLPETLYDGEEACAWLGEAMTMSLPPQNAPILVAVNLPEAGMPQLHEVESVEGDVLLTTCGERIPLSPASVYMPYRTRQVVTAADLCPGRRILVWGEMERVLLFTE